MSTPSVSGRSSSESRFERVALLNRLYAAQLDVRDDEYIELHSAAHFVRGTEQVFDWYRPFLPRAGRLLDWGCRHAPDSCLIAADGDSELRLFGCDTVGPESYQSFHEEANLDYQQLLHEFRLPYDDGFFDAVLGSGVIEHVPMVHDSVRELARVTRPGGVLVITFLPNRWSVGEWVARQRTEQRHVPGDAHHLRTFSLREITTTLSRSGFEPFEFGYQTHFDLLPLEPAASPRRKALSSVGGWMGAGRVAPCVAVVARRLEYF